MSTKLKKILSEVNWEGKDVQLGQVYSNPYATAFNHKKNL